MLTWKPSEKVPLRLKKENWEIKKRSCRYSIPRQIQLWAESLHLTLSVCPWLSIWRIKVCLSYGIYIMRRAHGHVSLFLSLQKTPMAVELARVCFYLFPAHQCAFVPLRMLSLLGSYNNFVQYFFMFKLVYG